MTRSVVLTVPPSRSTRKSTANSERSDWIGYSSSTSSSTWLQNRSRSLRERWPQHVGARLLERGEGLVRRQRHQRRDDARLVEQHAVLVDVDIVGEPDLGAVADRRFGAGDVERAVRPGREIGVDQGGEGEPEQELEPVAGGLEEGVDLDVGRDVVGAGGRDERPDERQAIAQANAAAVSDTPVDPFADDCTAFNSRPFRNVRRMRSAGDAPPRPFGYSCLAWRKQARCCEFGPCRPTRHPGLLPRCRRNCRSPPAEVRRPGARIRISKPCDWAIIADNEQGTSGEDT